MKSRKPFVSWLVLGVIVVVAAGLHLWGIRRDLPVQYEIDEPPFVLAAVKMAALGSCNPGWFGHPASTLIYPLAAVYHGWDVVDHAAFLNGTGEFYLIGRYLSVTYNVLGLLLVFAVGRRAFADGPSVANGDVVGLLGAWFTLLSPLTLEHAQMVRSDGASLLFTMLSLWLIVRLHDAPTPSRAVCAGSACGLAVSTKYSLAAVVAVLLGVSAMAVLGRTRVAPRSRAAPWWLPFAAVAAVVLTFILTSPYIFLDATTALTNLQTEGRATHPGADGLSRAQNFIWYLRGVIPQTLGEPRLLLMLGAVAVAIWRRRARPLILLGFVVVYLIEISLHPLHWVRWIIPVLPVLMLFAAAALCDAVARLADRLHLPRSAPAAVLALCIAFISVPPIRSIAAAARQHAQPSTQIVARQWALDHLSADGRIAQEWFTAPLEHTPLNVARQFSLANHSVDDYARSGYRYLMVSSAVYDTYYQEPARYAAEIAFYERLAKQGRLLQEIAPSADRGGPVVRIYELPAAEN